MWLMLQQNIPNDYVIATGKSITVRKLCELAFKYINLNYEDHVVIDPRFFRPAEVDKLLGDASKAKKILGWKAKVSIEQLVEMVMNAEVNRMAKT